jgi:hypothetical protein
MPRIYARQGVSRNECLGQRRILRSRVTYPRSAKTCRFSTMNYFFRRAAQTVNEITGGRAYNKESDVFYYNLKETGYAWDQRRDVGHH